MGSEWREFGNLYQEPSRNGLTRPRRVRGDGVKMVNMGELFAHSRIRDIEMDRVPLSEDEARHYLLQNKDLLFARQSLVLEGAGKCSIYLGAIEPVTFEGHLIRVRLNKDLADSLFYYYFFNSGLGRAAIKSIVEQVAAAGIRGSDLAKLRVPYPPLPEQRAIAHILGALDDKIELNRRMNATLEGMARALFKQWFVDGAEEGWDVKAISDLADINAWTLSKTDELDRIDYIEISEVSRGTINNIQTYQRGEEPSRARRRLRHGDTVLSTVRPERESYFLCLNPSPNLIASTGFAVVTPNVAPWSFIHAALTRSEVFESLGHLADGGAYPAIRPEVIGQWQVAWPSDYAIVDKFHKACSPLFEKAELNRRASRTLAALRDALLPRLISGELPVKDAERFITSSSP